MNPRIVLFVLIGVLSAACRPPGPKPKPAVVCVDFESPLVLAQQFGATVGQTPGDLAFTTSGINVTVNKFDFPAGGGAFNRAYIDNPPVAFGTGQTIRSNNINLEFDFGQLGFAVSQVEFEFLDLGGFENLAVNGGGIFAGELSSAPNPTGGITYSVSKTPAQGGSKGTVTVRGSVAQLTVGGQELWIDNVCARN